MGETTKTCCKSLIGILNLFTVIVGLAIVGVCISLLVQRNGEGSLLDGLSAKWVVWVPMAVGIALALIGGVGCCITLAENRCMLSIYALLQLAFGVAIVAAGAFVLVYVNAMDTVANNAVWSLSGSIVDESVSDFTTGLYGRCCVENSEAFLLSVEECTSADNSFESYCYFDEDMFKTGAGVNEEACGETRTDICYTDVSENGSGEGLKTMQSGFHAYAQEYLWPSGIAFAVFGSLVLLAFTGSIYICCNKRTTPKPADKPQTSSEPARNGNQMQYV